MIKIGQIVNVIVDRPLGTTHPEYKEMIYPVNYGYIEGIFSLDGEELDAYILGVDHAVDKYEGKVIAIIKRKNDIEDILVVCDENLDFSIEKIKELVYFQEKYFEIDIIKEEL